MGGTTLQDEPVPGAVELTVEVPDFGSLPHRPVPDRAPAPAPEAPAEGEAETAAGLDRRRVRLVFVGLMLTLLLAALDQTIVAT
ncbi:MAG TPA: hypothetical protein VFH77_07005, partial [Streptomyces sp.]|nr:hypothetical protein [Streptomyces sp.]